jgi:hypothetical protein
MPGETKTLNVLDKPEQYLSKSVGITKRIEGQTL